MRRNFFHTFSISFFVLALLFTLSREPLFFSNSAKSLATVVGVGALVEDNGYNRLAQELSAKENVLNQREQELQKKQESLLSGDSDVNGLFYKYIVASVLFLLLFLVLFNYYLDWKRTKRRL